MSVPVTPSEALELSDQVSATDSSLGTDRSGREASSVAGSSAVGIPIGNSHAVSGAGTARPACPVRQRLLDASCGKTDETWAWSFTFEGLLEADGFPLDDFPSLGTGGTGLPASIMQVLLRHNPAYVPLKHLDGVVSEVLRIMQVLHGPGNHHSCTGNGLLVFGPKGTGKSSVLQALAKPGVLREMLVKSVQYGEDFRGPDPSVRHTLVLSLDLRSQLPSSAPEISFTAWVLSALRHGHTSTVDSAFLNSQECKALQEKARTAFESGDINTDALNIMLRSCNIRVLVVVERAENLFSLGHFSAERAAIWKQQMMLVSLLAAPAIGIVLSASMQRARQLFLNTGTSGHSFPTYAHADLLADNWNGRKFHPVFVLPPAWTASSLAWYILQDAICRSRKADALRTAKALDAIFRAAPGIQFDPKYGIIPHMRAFLRLHGDTPSAITCAILSPAVWEARAPSSAIKDGSQTADMQTVLRGVLKLLSQAGKCVDISNLKASAAARDNDFQPRLLLGFDASTLRVARSELVNVVAESLKHSQQSEVSFDSITAASSLVDTAVDDGVLQELRVLEDKRSCAEGLCSAQKPTAATGCICSVCAPTCA